ncbi:MAG: hypothetical protein R3E79_53035 [Caldilineaceae bacterium]
MPIEEAQITLMTSAAITHLTAAALKLGASFAFGSPQLLFGVFITGTEAGGKQIGKALQQVSEFTESLGEGLSVTGEVLGVYANYMRMKQDWEIQLRTAQSDIIQIGHQLAGARFQQAIAQREIEILEKEIEHNATIQRFMQGKFTNAALYQWMAGRLSALYFQSYKLAYDMAKGAEKAFQYERGRPESTVDFITPVYWESQRKGLLAGESLGLDLDRMESAYLASDQRGFAITKQISLLALNPVAFLQLKRSGVCEFTLGEALFDYDFPGHYRRQIKTLSFTFHGAEGQLMNVNATLTQLSHKTVLEPDAKAVKYLLDPKGEPPLTLRSDWRGGQQLVLSHLEEYDKNNGLFELRYDDDRYLPFEGTGAVSTWRLELNGKKGAYNVEELVDVVMTVKYSAEQGGQGFANAVKGLLKPYETARFFDVATNFPDAWNTFINGGGDELVLPLSRDLFPNMSGGKISGIFARYELAEPGDVSFVLNEDRALTLHNGKYLLTPTLAISNRGAEWKLALRGDSNILLNIGLVLTYKADVV